MRSEASGSAAGGTAGGSRLRRPAGGLPVVGAAAEGVIRRPVGQVPAPVQRWAAVRRPGLAAPQGDVVAAEEPLEVRLVAGGEERVVAVTMRTPGADVELALGFLFAEGILRGPEEVAGVTDCPPDAATAAGAEGCSNRVYVELAARELPDLPTLDRHFFASSACGVCGKAGLETLRLAGHRPVASELRVRPEVLASLPARLREAQELFDATGGLHAAALFTSGGELVALREDVGRHNALDKLLGWAFAGGRLPLADGVVVVSGRSSYEIVQKCLAAGVPVLAAVSAPSSLAVELARSFRITLVGFLRDRGFNVYAVPERLAADRPETV